VLSTALFGKPAFKNLIVNGLVLAEDGKKMSKRLKNYPDPTLVVNNYGADALRLYLINSPVTACSLASLLFALSFTLVWWVQPRECQVVKAEPLKFKEAGVFDVVKTVFLPWYNAFRFFTQNVTRLELAGVKFDPLAYAPGSGKGNVMDRWILVGPFVSLFGWLVVCFPFRRRPVYWVMDSFLTCFCMCCVNLQAALADLVQFVRQEMAGYRLYTVVPRLVSFIDQLTNWYVRLNRRRLKGGDGPQEALVSLCALYDVLLSLCRLMAPFTPFFTETVYQHLRKMHPACNDASAPEDAVGRAASVHYLSIPEVDAASVDPAIVAAVETLQAVVEAGRNVRTKRNITQKFPVTEVIVVSADTQLLDYARSLESYIKEVCGDGTPRVRGLLVSVV
jgi:isoleucyl-tRNA synthetase